MLGNLLDASAALNLTLYHTLIQQQTFQSVTNLTDVINVERKSGLINCDVSFFFRNDFHFPYRGVVTNILGHLDGGDLWVVSQPHSFIRKTMHSNPYKKIA